MFGTDGKCVVATGVDGSRKEWLRHRLSLALLTSIVGQLGGEVEITAVIDNRRILIEA